MSIPELLSTKEAAALLGLAEVTLRKQRIEGARTNHVPVIPWGKAEFALRQIQTVRPHAVPAIAGNEGGEPCQRLRPPRRYMAPDWLRLHCLTLRFVRYELSA